MTVKELKENLDYYDDDAEIEFIFNQEVEVDSWRENKYGMKFVEIDKKLDICFIGDTNGAPWDELEKRIPHNNDPEFCYCDNFISFWELKWNFDDGSDWDGVPFIKKEAENEDSN